MAIRISIVVPNFNSGPVLQRALQSLIAQDYPNLQLILIDAVSTDESKQTIEKYRHIFDKVVIEKDKGNGDGVNKGLLLADGEILGWLCADDELLPGALKCIAAVFESQPDADVVTGACQRIFADNTTTIVPPNPNSWDIVGIQNPIEQSATFWRAKLQRKVGELNWVEFPLGFDWELWARFMEAGAKLVTTDQLLSRYYFSDTNKTSRAGRIFAEEAFRHIRRHGPLCGALAYIFRFLYKQFDLTGCYDRPPTCTLLRSHMFVWTSAFLRYTIGKRLLYLYNWHFAACQERGLKWW